MSEEPKIPNKIARIDRPRLQLLDILLLDDGTTVSPRGILLKETHRPLSLKQVSWIYYRMTGFYISRGTLAKYLDYLEATNKND
jgi:hypothetical protein